MKEIQKSKHGTIRGMQLHLKTITSEQEALELILLGLESQAATIQSRAAAIREKLTAPATSPEVPVAVVHRKRAARRKMTAAGREAISKAQKARWAKVKSTKRPKTMAAGA